VKNRFQNVPFKFNLQRYIAAGKAKAHEAAAKAGAGAVGLCRLNQVDP
jgi:hypothetical protein